MRKWYHSGLPCIPPAGGGFFSCGSAPEYTVIYQGECFFLGLLDTLRVPWGAGAGPEPGQPEALFPFRGLLCASFCSFPSKLPLPPDHFASGGADGLPAKASASPRNTGGGPAAFSRFSPGEFYLASGGLVVYYPRRALGPLRAGYLPPLPSSYPLFGSGLIPELWREEAWTKKAGRVHWKGWKTRKRRHTGWMDKKRKKRKSCWKKAAVPIRGVGVSVVLLALAFIWLSGRLLAAGRMYWQLVPVTQEDMDPACSKGKPGRGQRVETPHERAWPPIRPRMDRWPWPGERGDCGRVHLGLDQEDETFQVERNRCWGPWECMSPVWADW